MFPKTLSKTVLIKEFVSFFLCHAIFFQFILFTFDKHGIVHRSSYNNNKWKSIFPLETIFIHRDRTFMFSGTFILLFVHFEHNYITNASTSSSSSNNNNENNNKNKNNRKFYWMDDARRNLESGLKLKIQIKYTLIDCRLKFKIVAVYIAVSCSHQNLLSTQSIIDNAKANTFRQNQLFF